MPNIQLKKTASKYPNPIVGTYYVSGQTTRAELSSLTEKMDSIYFDKRSALESNAVEILKGKIPSLPQHITSVCINPGEGIWSTESYAQLTRLGKMANNLPPSITIVRFVGLISLETISIVIHELDKCFTVVDISESQLQIWKTDRTSIWSIFIGHSNKTSECKFFISENLLKADPDSFLGNFVNDIWCRLCHTPPEKFSEHAVLAETIENIRRYQEYGLQEFLEDYNPTCNTSQNTAFLIRGLLFQLQIEPDNVPIWQNPADPLKYIPVIDQYAAAGEPMIGYRPMFKPIVGFMLWQILEKLKLNEENIPADINASELRKNLEVVKAHIRDIFTRLDINPRSLEYSTPASAPLPSLANF